MGILETPWGHPRGNSSISRGMGARKKWEVFLILAWMQYYIEKFQKRNLAKVLILLLPPRYNALALWRVIHFPKESIFSLLLGLDLTTYFECSNPCNGKKRCVRYVNNLDCLSIPVSWGHYVQIGTPKPNHTSIWIKKWIFGLWPFFHCN